MPISGPTSYPPTIIEFLEHWEAVNAVVGMVDGLELSGGRIRPQLESHAMSLNGRIEVVTDFSTDLNVARGERDAALSAMQARLVQFNDRVRALLPGHPLTRALPAAFASGDGEGAVRNALRQMSHLWGKINVLAPVPPGLTLPLALPAGAYTRAMFDVDREALLPTYRAVAEKEVELRVAREFRNDLQEVIYEFLRDYRLIVPSQFPAGHALVESLPQLTPTGTRTPEPVAATGVWQAGTAQGKITWEASADADLARYEVRGAAGAEYVTQDESLLATVLPAAARELLTTFALGTPGLSASFKVYVILTTGNERGSEAVTVTRPAA